MTPGCFPIHNLTISATIIDSLYIECICEAYQPENDYHIHDTGEVQVRNHGLRKFELRMVLANFFAKRLLLHTGHSYCYQRLNHLQHDLSCQRALYLVNGSNEI